MLLRTLFAATLPFVAVPISATANTSASPECAGQTHIALVNASVLSMERLTIRRQSVVVVRDGRVASINPRQVPEAACRIDVGNQILMPGLSDMHVHTAESELPLFLANGVTLVREMNGSPTHLALKRRIDAGTLIGPRMRVASPLMVGAPLRYRHRLVKTAEDARAAVREAASAGYDYLKIYDELSLESYNAIVSLADSLGLPLDGHVPAAVGLPRVLESGQALQHMDKMAVALAGHTGDTTKLPVAARLFAGRRTWVTPTLASLRAMDMAGTTEYTARLAGPEMAWVDQGSTDWWKSLAGSRAPRARSGLYRFEVALLPVLRRAGTRFLAGTDAANPLMVAGFSLHEELETLVRDGGFTNAEVLAMATVNAGEFLGDSLRGRITEGAPADFILVSGDPTKDLRVLRRLVAVMTQGRWLARPQLDSMLTVTRHNSPPA